MYLIPFLYLRIASTASHPDEVEGSSLIVISGGRLKRLLVPINTVN